MSWTVEYPVKIYYNEGMISGSRHNTKSVAIALMLALLCGSFLLFAGSEPRAIKPDEIIEISNTPEALLMPWSFSVSDDEIFFIIDQGAGKIRVYENDNNTLELAHAVDGRGYGRGELVSPSLIYFDSLSQQLVVWDIDKKKILEYERSARKMLQSLNDPDHPRSKDEIDCSSFVHQFQLRRDTLYISADVVANDNDIPNFSLFSQNINSKKTANLLPAHLKYGYGIKEGYKDGDNHKKDDYKKDFKNKKNIRAMGVKGIFDIDKNGKYAYFAWEAGVNILKIDLQTKKEDITTLYEMTTRKPYEKPTASRELIDAFEKGNFKTVDAERQKLCYIRNLFVSSDRILVLYQAPRTETEQNFRARFLDLAGKFIKDVPVAGPLDEFRTWLLKGREQDTLYSLCVDPKNRTKYFVSKYIIAKD